MPLHECFCLGSPLRQLWILNAPVLVQFCVSAIFGIVLLCSILAHSVMIFCTLLQFSVPSLQVSPNNFMTYACHSPFEFSEYFSGTLHLGFRHGSTEWPRWPQLWKGSARRRKSRNWCCTNSAGTAERSASISSQTWSSTSTGSHRLCGSTSQVFFSFSIGSISSFRWFLSACDMDTTVTGFGFRMIAHWAYCYCEVSGKSFDQFLPHGMKLFPA